MKKLLLIAGLLFSMAVLANEGGGHDSGGGSGNFLPMEPLIINMRSASGGGYLSFTSQLKLADPKDGETIKVHMPMLRHLLIKSLIGKDIATIQTVEFISNYSHNAAAIINKALGDEYVKEVLFDRWLVQ